MAAERLWDLPGRGRLFVSESRGKGLPVLFSNSLAADMRTWAGVRKRLTRTNFAYDTRGHGQSPVVPGPCTVDDLARDAIAVMDAAGLDTAVICGLSLGGATAMAIAEKAPERVAGLVLANTAVTFPPPEMWQERAAQARRGEFPALVAPTLERWLTEEFRTANPDAADRVRRVIAATPPEGYAACCGALAAADLTAALSGYAGPVLLLAGAHDQSTPIARAEEMKSLAANAELAVLDAAHLSSVEAEADFADRLEAFVAAIEKDRSHV